MSDLFTSQYRRERGSLSSLICLRRTTTTRRMISPLTKSARSMLFVERQVAASFRGLEMLDRIASIISRDRYNILLSPCFCVFHMHSFFII